MKNIKIHRKFIRSELLEWKYGQDGQDELHYKYLVEAYFVLKISCSKDIVV